jgi:hypothetical protein
MLFTGALFMEITVKKEDLSLHDCGGGFREVDIIITVDKTLSPRLQRQAVIFEVIGALTDPFETDFEFITEMTEKIGDALDQL